MKLIYIIKEILARIGYPFVKLIQNFVRIGFLIINFRWFRDKYFWMFGIMLVLTGLTMITWEIVKELPNVDEIYNPPKLSTKIYDKNRVLLYSFYDGENRSWIPLKKIPKILIEATLAIEDKNFFYHQGWSVKGIVTAIIYNIKHEKEGALRGGSTITQQLVKNVFFSSEKTWIRKARELILAIMIERKLSKEEILERYFNQVAYGGETYGVQEAALKYFNKNVEDISKAEASYLAGLPAAPSWYSPVNNQGLGLGLKRQKLVIDELVNGGYITREDGENIKKEKLTIQLRKTEIKAPHFVFYIRDYLKEKYDLSNFERRGLTIVTSLDYEKQKMAEKIVLEEIDKVKNLNITNGASLILNVKSGDILAMVGSKDYFNKEIDGKFNVTTAIRQPGSAIKPINYLLALIKGWTLASLIDDEPVVYNIAGQKPYIPRNYNNKFMGWVTIKTALASSLNIPSVKLLANNGVEEMIDLAEKLGITTWGNRNRFGLSLALGSGEVRMTELATAYSVMANSGEKIEINPILKIENYLGEEIYQKVIERERIVNEEYTFLINQTLSDDEARAPIFGRNSKLVIPNRTVAVKTGTTNNLKDNWCIGWTPKYLVATWVGNNNNSPMSWVASGVSGATPIWNRIMKQITLNEINETWEIPKNIVKVANCGKSEYFIEGTEKNVRCTPTNKLQKTNTAQKEYL